MGLPNVCCMCITASRVFLHMSLRAHLDRYCMQRAMTTDLLVSPSRSRSPIRAPTSSSSGLSPFYRPPGWQPRTAPPHRPIILQIDLKPMQQLANQSRPLLQYPGPASRRQPHYR